MNPSTHTMNEAELARQIRSACDRLRAKLLGLDLKTLAVTDYTRFYLKKKIQLIDSFLDLYGHILLSALRNRSIPVGRFVFVDYGGGTGVLSFLAKELGVGTVVYNDIYGVLCQDMPALAQALGLPLDHIVCGDVDNLVEYAHDHELKIHAVASYDVLEHVYDIGAHFKKMGLLAHDDFRVFYASGANIQNASYVRRIKKLQQAAEYENRKGTAEIADGSSNDNLRAFFEVRRDIIAEFAPELGAEKTDLLARATRGLRREDIQQCVEEYRQTGTVSYRPDHPTNTCDPYSGYWAEHLMEIGWLQQTLRTAGFETEIHPGYYPMCGARHKRALKVVVNQLIRLLGRRALFLTLYFIVQATPLSGARGARESEAAKALV